MKPTDPIRGDDGRRPQEEHSRPTTSGTTAADSTARDRPPALTAGTEDAWPLAPPLGPPDPGVVLRRLDAVHEAVHRTTEALDGVSSRGELESALERLAEGDCYAGVAFRGTVDRWEATAATGTGADPLPESDAAGPVAWRNRRTVPDPLPDCEAIPSVEEGAWALVPIGRGGTTFGHLVLATERPDAFGQRELAVLERLGTTVGLAVDALGDRRLLRSDAVTEVEFASPRDALTRIAREAGCGLRLEGLVPADDVVAFLGVDGAAVEAVVAAARALDCVGTAQCADDRTAEVALRDGSALVPLSRGGATVKSARADGDGTRVVAEVAPSADVRGLAQGVAESAPETRLAAKRERDRPPGIDRTPGGSEATPLGRLTDRQRETLEAAYRSGYFEWPRDRTAEELAESLDISSPTLHRHLRVAERSVLSELFEAGPDPPSARPE